MDADVYAAVLRRRERQAGLAQDVELVDLTRKDRDAKSDPLAPSKKLDASLGITDELEFTQAELLLRQDFCKNKVCWYDHWRKDLWCFLINMNPILSVCYSHPLHPIGRYERLLVYAASFVWVTLVATTLAEAQTCVKCQITSCSDMSGSCNAAFNTNATSYHGCHDASEALMRRDTCEEALSAASEIFRPEIFGQGVELDEKTHTFTVNFCCIADRMWMIWFLETFNKGMFQGMNLGGPAYSLVSNIVFSIGCFQLMLCGCVQFASYRKRKCGECIGYVAFALVSCWLLGTLLWLGPYVLQLNDGMRDAMRNFLLAKTGSWIGATVFNVIVFTAIWPLQRPKSRGLLKSMDPPRFPLPDHRGFISKAACPRFHVLAAEYVEFVRPDFDPEVSLELGRMPSFVERATSRIERQSSRTPSFLEEVVKSTAGHPRPTGSTDARLSVSAAPGPRGSIESSNSVVSRAATFEGSEAGSDPGEEPPKSPRG